MRCHEQDASTLPKAVRIPTPPDLFGKFRLYRKVALKRAGSNQEINNSSLLSISWTYLIQEDTLIVLLSPLPATSSLILTIRDCDHSPSSARSYQPPPPTNLNNVFSPHSGEAHGLQRPELLSTHILHDAPVSARPSDPGWKTRYRSRAYRHQHRSNHQVRRGHQLRIQGQQKDVVVPNC